MSSAAPTTMTSPMTTLIHGDYAPLLHRPSAAPPSTLPQRRKPLFLRRDLRQRADDFANPLLLCRYSIAQRDLA